MKKPKPRKKMIGSGRYATGRIRSLESRLMDRQALERLVTAASLNDIRQLMNEAGYADGEIFDALAKERQSLYDLIYEISPDPEYLDLIRLEEDAHNVKVGLRKRLVAPDEPLDSYRHLYRETAVYHPGELDADLRADDLRRYPEWLRSAADAARQAYAETFDAARIDLAVDRVFAAYQKEAAAALDSPWLNRYLALVFDLKNTETLYRVRRREIGRSLYEMSLLPDGRMTREEWLALYDDEVSDIPAYLARGPYEKLAELVEYELENERQGNWSQAADLFVMEHLRETKRYLTGPEVPLGFMLARRQEMRSIRLIAAAVRSGLGLEKRRQLVRDSYLERG
ncbi:MAG TPA: V-type ATPase subunit [Clostridiaceae bacterium]|nr:V-type ATPase subunit [Clostridiaceae bacterium]